MTRAAGGDGRRSSDGRLRNWPLFTTPKRHRYDTARDKSRRDVSRVNASATPSEPSLPFIVPFSQVRTSISLLQPPRGPSPQETPPQESRVINNSAETPNARALKIHANPYLDIAICQKLNTLASKHVPCLRRVPTRPKPNGAAGLSPSARPDYIVPGTSFHSPKTSRKTCTIPLTAPEHSRIYPSPNSTAHDSTQRATASSDTRF